MEQEIQWPLKKLKRDNCIFAIVFLSNKTKMLSILESIFYKIELKKHYHLSTASLLEGTVATVVVSGTSSLPSIAVMLSTFSSVTASGYS